MQSLTIDVCLMKQEPKRVKVVPKLPNPSVFKGVKPDKDGVIRMPENGKYQ